ncbi:MAG: LacI family DNA-binding transcriptional regulator [Opitutaceae bacterium]|nr:LacI family DNA-binding transcriptional regulator [Opitutaceae bacterium]
MPEKRPTLADIAARCGVTVMTVSRALRAGTQVAPATRAAVEAAAKDLGYRADPFMSVLVNYRENLRSPTRRATIAYVMNYPAGTPWREWPVFRDFLGGVTTRAAELGYGVEEFSLREAGNLKRAADIMRNRGYVGVVLAPSIGPSGHTRLDLRELPSVTLGHSLRAPRLNYAVGDVFRSTGDLMHQLKRLGYRRPGFAAIYEFDARIEHRASAAFLSWQALFVAVDQRLPVCMPSAERFTKDTTAWFKKNQPDVVVSLGVWPAQMLEQSGTVFPRDAGFASVALNADDQPRFSGMKINHTAIGTAATDLLHAQILRGEKGVPPLPRGVHVDATWHAGDTAPKKR